MTDNIERQSLEIAQYQLPEQLSTTYTFTIGDYNFWFYGWFALVMAVVAVIVLAVIVLVIRAVVHKHDNSATKTERRSRAKKKMAEEKKAAQPKRDIVQETLDAAPKLTAFTPAEYPDGIDPLMWLAEDGISDAEHEKRTEIYHEWCAAQKELYDKQLNARRQYFAKNDFGFKVQISADDSVEEEHSDVMTPAEKKEYERIRRDNEKRLARARKLKAKEEAEAKRAAKKK